MGPNIKSFSIFFMAVIALCFTISCSKDKNTPTPSKPKLKVASVEESLAYTFQPRESCGAGYCDNSMKFENCDTIQSFENKNDFCAGLQDGPLNNYCAKDEREALFKKSCRGDLEETELGGISFSGDDARMGQCSFEIPVTSGNQYCLNLKDETLNNYCGWEQRRSLFRQYGCADGFSTLTEEQALRDDGEIIVTGPKYNYLAKSNIVRSLYRKTFKLPKSAQRGNVIFTDLILREDNCEVLGQARFSGKILDTTDGTGHTLASTFPFSAVDPSISPEREYEFTIELSNPGLCQDLEFGFTMVVDRK